MFSGENNLYTLLDSKSKLKIGVAKGRPQNPQNEPQKKTAFNDRASIRTNNEYMNPVINELVELLKKQNNLFFIMPYCFDVKDAEGNVLMSVESADFYSQDEDAYISEEEEEQEDHNSSRPNRNGGSQKPKNSD